MARVKKEQSRTWRGVIGALWLAMVWGGVLPAASASTALGREAIGSLLAQGGNRLFVDDFSTQSGRWSETQSPKGGVTYADEALNLRVVSPGVTLWSLPDFRVERAGYSYEVSVAVNDASPDSQFGLIAGYASDADFYAFLLTPDGHWRLLHRDRDVWVDLTPADAIFVEGAGDIAGSFVLATALVDNNLTLFVDSEQVGQVPVPDLPAPSGFGVMAWAGHGYVDVSFDDVVVSDVGG